MIVKSTVGHNVGIGVYTKHWLRRCYNAFPSVFAKPMDSNKLFTFVVGCGHSGTTLMAAKLSNHSAIMGIGRETNVFSLGNHSLLSVKAIAQEWDYFSSFYGYSCVLEKTPKHIYAYRNIQKIIPNNKFVVMIRNPLDTIASLYKRFENLEFCVERWVYDNAEAINFLGKENVLFVRYEDFTQSPETALREVIEFLGYEYEESVLSSEDTVYSKTPQKDNMRLREAQVGKPVKPNNGGWEKVFDKEQAASIMSKVGRISEQLGYKRTAY